MSHWHYGIIRSKIKSTRQSLMNENTYNYGLHEIYFDDYGSESISDPIILDHYVNPKELKEDLKMMLKDSKKLPVYEFKNNKLIKIEE